MSLNPFSFHLNPAVKLKLLAQDEGWKLQAPEYGENLFVGRYLNEKKKTLLVVRSVAVTVILHFCFIKLLKYW